MNYSANDELGSAIVAAGSALYSVGKSAYQYHEAVKETDEYNANMALANAENTATARQAARDAKYASNLERIMGNIDKQKAKRYLIIGAAIGVPLIAGLALSRKD